MPKEIATPFRIGSDGRIVTVSDPDVQVRQHVESLINTQPDERVNLNDYGVDTTSLLFEDADPDEIAATVSTRVGVATARWEPGVELLSVIPSVSDNEVSQVDIQYARRDAPLSGTAANVNMAIIGSNGAVKEVIRG